MTFSVPEPGKFWKCGFRVVWPEIKVLPLVVSTASATASTLAGYAFVLPLAGFCQEISS